MRIARMRAVNAPALIFLPMMNSGWNLSGIAEARDEATRGLAI